MITNPDCVVITTAGAADIMKKGKETWLDWDVLSAKVRAKKRDKDEEF